MESNSIFFSIIIPCYNQGHFLSECLNSLSNQSFLSWEALVINDGSTDHTSVIASKFSKKDNRIILINQKNVGLSGARNTGMKLSRGEYLLFLDADDWLEKNCLSTFFLNISENPNFELYKCGYSYCDKFNGIHFHHHLPNEYGKIFPKILTVNLGPVHSVLIRGQFAMELGDFDLNLKSCEDWDFWIRAGKMGANVFSIPERLVVYRYVPNSMSRNAKQMYEYLLIVSKRAPIIDRRIPFNALFNKDYKIDINNECKKLFIICLGVNLFQNNLEESIHWYFEEKEKNNWIIYSSDWLNLSSYLTFKYFLSSELIDKVFLEVQPIILSFFVRIGYSKSEANSILFYLFLNHKKKNNHLKYGKLIGSIINKVKY